MQEENVKIEIEVSSKTAKSLEQIREWRGVSEGKLINRFLEYYQPDKPDLAALLILEDMYTFTMQLDDEDRLQTFCIVIDELYKVFSQHDLNLCKVLTRFGGVLNEKYGLETIKDYIANLMSMLMNDIINNENNKNNEPTL